MWRTGDLRDAPRGAESTSPQSASHADTVLSARSRIRIVVADDHPIFRDGVCRLLAAEEDFAVVAQAEDGQQVPDVLRQHEPDILLLDLNMPGLDGLATLERLAAEKSKTRIIVLTASDEGNEFLQSLKRGASGIVLKQAATESLIEAIRTVHAGGSWLDPHATVAVINRRPPPVQPASRRNQVLSPREQEVVTLVSQGFRNADIAKELLINEQTVKNYLRNIFEKLGVTDRLELALYAAHKQLHPEASLG
jgi:DNA-binding NarL/FixJ family response regulator